MIERFLETTWFLWWLFAMIVVGRWASRFFATDADPAYHQSPHWKDLYRQALSENDETKIHTRIQEAEGAILVELTTQVFARDNTERIALQEAMDQLDTLRRNRSEISAGRVSA